MTEATDTAGPPDDESILDEHTLVRRVNADWIVPDGAGGVRVSGQAFQDLTAPDGTKAMSAHVLERLVERGLTVDASVQDLPGYGFVLVPVGAVREKGLGVTWAPEPDDGIRGEAHVHVICKKTGGVQRALVNASVIGRMPGR